MRVAEMEALGIRVSVTITECNFNNNQEPFCEWTQSKGDDGDWKRQFGPTPTTGTGPPGDYPDGKGHYIYQEADDIGAGQSVKLESPIIVTPVNLCVEFRYYMYGTSQGSELNVQVLNASSSLVVWKQQGIQSSSWLYGSVTVPYSNWHSTRVVFEAIRGSTNLFDIALDNVAVKKGVCTVGSYMLLDSFDASPGLKAHLKSPEYLSQGCLALKFHYYMYGTAATMTLNVYAAPSGSALGDPLFTLQGNQGPGWKPAEVHYTGDSKVQFVIEGVYGETLQTDIAVDAVCIDTCQVGNTTAPSTGTPKPPVSSTTAASTGTPKPPATPVTETSTKPPSTKTTTASGSSTGTTIRPSITTPGSCPPNAHFEPCGSACPPRCEKPDSTCNGTCVPGCSCNPGFVLQGKRCVPVERCGCFYKNGTYYEPGQVIWGEGCTDVCHCLGNYTFHCTNTGCAPSENCKEVNGAFGCYPKGSSTCTASGDPHYTTFDKKKYNFHGNCTYILSKPCNSTQTPFAVYASNEYRNGHRTVAYIKAVYVHVYGVVVSLLKNRVVQINGNTMKIPNNPVPGLSVTSSGKHVVVETDFGLRVRYDGNHHAEVKVPSNYQNELCGLCGDYNGSPRDDFKTPGGVRVKNANDFGNSWNVHENCTATDDEVIPECTEAEREDYEGPTYCGILLDPNGPFVTCHTKVDPKSFFEDCTYDMCELDGSKPQLCQALESYINECQERNVTLRPWRNETFCPLKCPPNSHYEPCGSACPANCLDPRPQSCDKPCVEGCQCDEGLVLNGDQCVRKHKCGCTYNGVYYPPGQVIFSEACKEVCKCLADNNTQCVDTSCAPNEYCADKNGVQGCYPKGSSTCTASGDPHYTTFDKKKYNFHGNCTYVLSKPCNSTQTPFAVYASNEYRNGHRTVAYVKAVYVHVYGVVVSLLKNRVVQVR
nr:PREDICTED: zonadhesin-like [Latimeria chalumnae]|eukprot:XP_014346130.1 PREDICTED: zonadhesin-like [Latimeria chalumnae]